MPRICYTPKNFKTDALGVIAEANRICASYQAQGFDLTLRQLYYQFVARALIPNRDTEYKRLGSIINDARLAGLLDWNYIVDRTRNLRSLSHWNSPASVIRSAARSYKRDLWETQPTRVEVWIEKDALVGVIEGVCERNDVPFFSCRGYTSQSEVWGAAQRIGEYLRTGQDVVILHLGDHDPSGLDMTRDIRDRLDLFIDHDKVRAGVDWLEIEQDAGNLPHHDDYEGPTWTDVIEPAIQDHVATFGHLSVERIALNMDQVDQYDPPPNPAKLTDVRARKYIERWGSDSWELDALEPTVLADLIDNAIDENRDTELWEDAVTEEQKETQILNTVSARWNDVKDFLTAEAS